MRTLASLVTITICLCACAPAPSLESVAVVDVVGLTDECVLGEAPRAAGVLDLALADRYFAPLRFAAFVDGRATDDDAGVVASRVFFTSSFDLVLATTPRTADGARVLPVAGVASSPSPRDIAFTMLIDVESATSLAREPALIEALAAGGRARIDAHVALDGQLRERVGPPRDQLFSSERNPPSDPVAAPSEPVFFTFPIDLCAGCLRPTCPDDEVIKLACIPGQDEPSLCAVSD